MRIVLICGDRNWDNLSLVSKTLRKEHEKAPITYVIEGGQKSTYQGSWGEDSWKGHYGADYQGKVAAQLLGIQVIECPSNWEVYGRKAGPIRNQQQLNLAVRLVEDYKDLLVLAFHSDLEKSKGTKDMIKRVRSQIQNPNIVIVTGKH